MKTILFSAAISLVTLSSAMGGDFQKAGGSSFTLRVRERVTADGAKMPITREQVNQTMKAIEKRLNSMGVAGSHIAQEGKNGIIVELPEVKTDEADRIRAALEAVGIFELRAVSPRNDERGADGKSLAQRVQNGEEIVPGYRAFIQKFKDENGNEVKDEKGNAVTRPILLRNRAALNDFDIASAVPAPQQADFVAITLNAGGTAKMIKLTENMRPGVDRIAILLNGEVISAPVVVKVPLGRQFLIPGFHKPGEAQSVANALMNPLGNPLEIEETRTVPPKAG